MDALQGYKTYIIALAIGMLATAHKLGYLDDQSFNLILTLLGSGGLATLAAKMNRTEVKSEAALNTAKTLVNIASGEYGRQSVQNIQNARTGIVGGMNQTLDPRGNPGKKYAPFLLSFLFLLIANSIAAAQATPSSKLVWDVPASLLSEAQSYTYKIYVDGATTGTVLSNVTCTGTTTFSCQVPFPAFTPGTHNITLTASNAAGESAKSSPFTFTFVVIPGVPTNIRIG